MRAVEFVLSTRHPGLLLAGVGCLLIAAAIGTWPR